MSVARRLRTATDAFTPSRYNAPYPLVTPTYDGSGQAVHPSVIDFGTDWNGHRFWMAMTPYPNSNDDFENPSILVSDDGETWIEPAGITNPIDPWPGGSAHNADPDLLYDGSDLWCFYVGSGDIVYRSSTDGVTWGEEGVPFTTPGLALSPTFIKDGDTYRVWYVMPSQATPVKYRTSSDPASGWSAQSDVTMPPPPSDRRIWHLEVKKHDGAYLGLICTDNGTNGQGALLHLGASADGLTWTVDDAILSPISGRWDSGVIYRASMRIVGTDADVWYSAKSAGGQWRIGRTTIPLAEFPTP